MNRESSTFFFFLCIGQLFGAVDDAVTRHLRRTRPSIVTTALTDNDGPARRKHRARCENTCERTCAPQDLTPSGSRHRGHDRSESEVSKATARRARRQRQVGGAPSAVTAKKSCGVPRGADTGPRQRAADYDVVDIATEFVGNAETCPTTTSGSDSP